MRMVKEEKEDKDASWIYLFIFIFLDFRVFNVFMELFKNPSLPQWSPG